MTLDVERITVAPSLALRALDALECIAAGLTPEDALERSVAVSDEAWVVSAGGEPLAVWGLNATSLLTSTANVWMLTTPAVDRHRVAFARESLRLCRDLTARYTLYAAVWEGHEPAIRLLAWLGFSPTGRANSFFLMERPRWV